MTICIVELDVKSKLNSNSIQFIIIIFQLKMSIDFALSITYCCFWGILLLPLIFITVRILTKHKDSRDIYSIATFVFMIVMLSMRTLTILPILMNNRNFNDFEGHWEEIIFNGIPLNLFSLAILIHTFRWLKLQVKLMSSRSYPK